MSCCSLDGIETRTAQNILAEIGVDMSVFPSDRHLASWGGQCPGNDQSAGKRRSGRTGKGSRWLDDALKDVRRWPRSEPTTATSRPNTSGCARPRIGHGRALGAVKHSIICACWHMLSTGELYRRPWRRLLPPPRPPTATRRLIAQLEALGHTVTLQEAPLAA